MSLNVNGKDIDPVFKLESSVSDLKKSIPMENYSS